MSRIRHTLLTYPKTQGGVGLPDFELYHREVLLSRVLEWFPRPFPKVSTMVEQDLSTLDLQALLWGYGQHLHLLSSTPPLTTTALHLWYKKACYRYCPQTSHPSHLCLIILHCLKECAPMQ